MPSIQKLLVYYLVILAFFLNSSWAHNCVHHEMNLIPSKAKENHRHKRFIHHNAADYKPIRMTFDYSNIHSSESDVEDYIKETLLPPVHTYFEATLKVIPRTSKIYAEPGACWKYAEIPENALKEGYEGDLVIFVVLRNEPEEGYLAQATTCRLDPTTSRPILGAIIFNRAHITLDMKDTTLEQDISTTQHEITHILGFSHQLYRYYVNPETLQPITGHVFKKIVNGVETVVLNLPALTQRLRIHFNCSTIEGAYLENQGGAGSLGAHFERRIFFNEFMTASDIQDPRFSEFTLAVLEGTGWYQVDYEHAEPMTYGKNAGCAFLDTKCINPETLQSNFKEFCSPLTSKAITWTRRGFGSCGLTTMKTDPDLLGDFDYWGNKTRVLDSYSDNCPQVVMFSEGDCEDEKRKPMLPDYEYSGVGAKAFLGTLNLGWSYGQPPPYGYCFRPQCVKKENGNYDLKVLFGSAGYALCSAAGNMNSSSFTFNNTMDGELECPDPNDFCNQVLSEGYCKGNCYANGECRQDGCHCYEGWESYNCAQEAMDDNCSRCDPNSHRTTCYGDQCICNPANVTCMCALGLKTGAQCDSNNGNINNPNFPWNDDFLRIVALGGGVALIVIIITVTLRLKKKQKSKGNEELSQNMLDSQQSQLQASIL